jgi:hypothetical protein
MYIGGLTVNGVSQKYEIRMYKCSRLHGGDLSLCLGALFQLCHLLALDGWCSDFLTKDDVAYLTGS